MQSHDDCIEIQGKRNPTGYGSIRLHGRLHLSHRVVWAIYNGKEAPQAMVVMHTCDNPACINPYHLRLGTQRDNVHDMVRKGRYKTKLSDEDRAEICHAICLGVVSQYTLAKRFKVSQRHIGRVGNA